MCGRYSQGSEISKLISRFQVPLPQFSYSPRYNIAPSQNAPIIIHQEERTLALYRWGLIPPWAKSPNIGQKMINARAETIEEKPSFKKLVQSKRCLVPADGFYEWMVNPDSKTKTPTRIILKSKELFAFAGLWDNWKGPSGEEINSFTIITTQANSAIQAIHHRMPVILFPEDEEPWLDRRTDPSKILGFLKPYSPDNMAFYTVSRMVNSPQNDSPKCISPIS